MAADKLTKSKSHKRKEIDFATAAGFHSGIPIRMKSIFFRLQPGARPREFEDHFFI